MSLIVYLKERDNSEELLRERSSIGLMDHRRVFRVSPSRDRYWSAICGKAPLFTSIVDRAESAFKALLPGDTELNTEMVGHLNLCHERSYLLANTDSIEGLETKRSTIEECKARALEEHLSNDQTIEKKNRIDIQMLTMSPYKETSKFFKIIQAYWKMIAKNPHRSFLCLQTEKRMISLIEDLMIGMVSYQPTSHERHEIIKQIYKNMRNLLQISLGRLREDLSNAETKEEALQLKYLIVKGFLVAPTLANATVAEPLCKNIINTLREEIQFRWLDLAKTFQREDIERNLDEINKINERISHFESLRQINAFYADLMIEQTRKLLEPYQKALQEARERNLYKEACELAKAVPEELEALTEPLTKYDLFIQSIYTVDLELPDIAPIVDPVAYFVESYKKEDGRILNLLEICFHE